MVSPSEAELGESSSLRRRLILLRRAPSGIVMGDRAGPSQIEPGAADFEADQEERHLGPLKGLKAHIL